MIVDCWVYGEHANSIFSVEISEKKTVRDLKQRIKSFTPDRLCSVTADHLELCSIPRPDDEHLEHALQQWNPEGSIDKQLSSAAKLSSLMSQHLIIVNGPSSSSRAAEPSVVATDMTLNCWVRGQVMDPFTVTISITERVWDLQKAIKNKNSEIFRNMDPNDITLFKVSLPFGEDGSIKGVLDALTVSSLGKPLWSIRRLSAIFDTRPPANQLHFVVEGEVPLQCWIRGTDPAHSFAVPVSMGLRVDSLKNVLKAARKDFDDVFPGRLKLYKIPVDNKPELQEIVGGLGSGHLLLGDEFLGKIFNDVPFSQMPGVVLEISKYPLWRYRLMVDPITAARTAFLASATTEQHHKSIPCGRPRNYEETIPAVLMHPVFAHFDDDCQNIKVTAEDEMFAERLATTMLAFYKNEPERVKAVARIFESYNIHFTVSETKTVGYMIDAYMSFNEHRYVIAAFTDETGNVSADPYFQAIGYYLEATRESALTFNRSPLPCLLLAISGPRMEFAGAAWNLRPAVQLLSTPIAFHFHINDDRNRNTVARYMAAFRKATESLKQYYKGLREENYENLPATPLPMSATVVPPPVTMFPYPRSYKSRCDDAQISFEYSGQLHGGKLIFSGIEKQSGRSICVKFVQTYSPIAHDHLAALGCAPALRGFEQIAGGWIMVVMDMLPAEFEMLDGCAHKEPVVGSLFDEISEAVLSLHQAGYVHGDIRDTNIMVSTVDKDVKFMIIDFDWAGKIGQTRYPLNVNRARDLWRPDDAVDRALITVEHDMKMLDHIVRQYKRDHLVNI